MPPGDRSREYEAMQFCLAPREYGIQGHYIMVGLSTLSGPHMRLRDVMLIQPDFHREPTSLLHSWHEPRFQAPSSSDAMDTPRPTCKIWLFLY